MERDFLMSFSVMINVLFIYKNCIFSSNFDPKIRRCGYT